MTRQIVLLGAAIILLSSTVAAQAGGWPRLCLPLNGVTNGNAEDCRQLVNQRLGLRLTPSKVRRNVVELVQQDGQWYIAMFLTKNVGLSEVEKALEGSDFSLARDRLRLFGHANLVVQAPEKSRDSLLADLKEVRNVSVGSTKKLEDSLQITIDMPYPMSSDGKGGSLDWVEYRWGDLSSEQSRRHRDPIMADGLPSYRLLQQLIKMHGGTLNDIDWGISWGCRTLGCVAETR